MEVENAEICKRWEAFRIHDPIALQLKLLELLERFKSTDYLYLVVTQVEELQLDAGLETTERLNLVAR